MGGRMRANLFGGRSAARTVGMMFVLVVSIAVVGCNSGLAIGLQNRVELDEEVIPDLPQAAEDQQLSIVSDYLSLKISWEPSTDTVLDDSELEYRLSYSLVETEVTGEAMLSGGTLAMEWTAGATSVVVSGLSYGTDYFLGLAVRDRADNRAYYPVMPASTADDDRPPTPGGGLTVTAFDTDSITVGWLAATDHANLTAQADLEYKVVYSGTTPLTTLEIAEASGEVALEWATGSTGLEITGLTDNWSYDIAVLVRDDKGLKSWYGAQTQATNKLPRLFFAQTPYADQKIGMAALDGTGLTNIITAGFLDESRPVEMAVDPLNHHIYWVDLQYGDTLPANGAIFRADFDGNNVVTLIDQNLTDPFGIAVDYSPPNTYLYWTDEATDTVFRSPLLPPTTDAADYVLLDSADGVSQPYGIAVDVESDDFYWLQGSGTYLTRATAVDPDTNMQLLMGAGTGPGTPIGITIDPPRDSIFWTTQSPGTVQSRLFSDGFNSSTTLVDTNILGPFGIGVDPDSGDIFWADLPAATVHRRPLSALPAETDADDFVLSSLGALQVPAALGVY